LGFYDGIPDGIWGSKSRAATEKFQGQYKGLTPTGTADDATQKALRDAVAYGMPQYEAEGSAESVDFWDDVEFFDREEFRCKCDGKHCKGFPAEPKEAMVRLANGARKHFGRPGFVVSGLRCKEWNRIQGGVENSQHMYGEACDLQIQGVSADDLLSYIQKQPGVRYAYKINGTNVHFDIPKGKR
jgi:hypothetical protein